MKYLVELKFTNPSHEHISLRRRVESVTRLVEATNEDQAILRASQQHRSLGFFIKEAKVVKEKSHDKEGADETMVAKGKEVMKKAEGKDEEDEEKAEDIEEAKGTASYPLLKPGQKLKPMKLKEEEVELSEASKEGKNVMRGMRASLKSMDLRHGVDLDKRVSGYKMSPAVKAAQAKSDALSKPEKKHQAGTTGAHKARKAAERMVDAAKKKVNKINMNPSMEQK